MVFHRILAPSWTVFFAPFASGSTFLHEIPPNQYQDFDLLEEAPPEQVQTTFRRAETILEQHFAPVAPPQGEELHEQQEVPELAPQKEKVFVVSVLGQTREFFKRVLGKQFSPNVPEREDGAARGLRAVSVAVPQEHQHPYDRILFLDTQQTNRAFGLGRKAFDLQRARFALAVSHVVIVNIDNPQHVYMLKAVKILAAALVELEARANLSRDVAVFPQIIWSTTTVNGGPAWRRGFLRKSIVDAVHKTVVPPPATEGRNIIPSASGLLLPPPEATRWRPDGPPPWWIIPGFRMVKDHAAGLGRSSTAPDDPPPGGGSSGAVEDRPLVEDHPERVAAGVARVLKSRSPSAGSERSRSSTSGSEVLRVDVLAAPTEEMKFEGVFAEFSAQHEQENRATLFQTHLVPLMEAFVKANAARSRAFRGKYGGELYVCHKVLFLDPARRQLCAPPNVSENGFFHPTSGNWFPELLSQWLAAAATVWQRSVGGAEDLGGMSGDFGGTERMWVRLQSRISERGGTGRTIKWGGLRDCLSGGVNKNIGHVMGE